MSGSKSSSALFTLPIERRTLAASPKSGPIVTPEMSQRWLQPSGVEGTTLTAGNLTLPPEAVIHVGPLTGPPANAQVGTITLSPSPTSQPATRPTTQPANPAANRAVNAANPAPVKP